MEPLSVGHYSLFSRIDTGIGKTEKLPGPGDLALMLWIVQRPWQRAVKSLGGIKQRVYCRLVAWLFRTNPEFFKVVLFDFLRYWQFQNETWELWRNETADSSEEKTSQIQSVRWLLMSEWNYTHTEIMDMPWKLAVSDAFGCLVIKDKLKIVTPTSRGRREWVSQKMGAINAR